MSKLIADRAFCDPSLANCSAKKFAEFNIQFFAPGDQFFNSDDLPSSSMCITSFPMIVDSAHGVARLLYSARCVLRLCCYVQLRERTGISSDSSLFLKHAADGRLHNAGSGTFER